MWFWYIFPFLSYFFFQFFFFQFLACFSEGASVLFYSSGEALCKILLSNLKQKSQRGNKAELGLTSLFKVELKFPKSIWKSRVKDLFSTIVSGECETWIWFRGKWKQSWVLILIHPLFQPSCLVICFGERKGRHFLFTILYSNEIPLRFGVWVGPLCHLAVIT